MRPRSLFDRMAQQETGSILFRKCLATASLLILAAAAGHLSGESLPARCGQGFVEEVNGRIVLHLKGGPHEMGYQHGALLRDHVRENLRFLLEEKGKSAELEVMGFKLTPPLILSMIADLQRKHLPEDYLEEIRGLAEGAGLLEEQVRQANFIPELFHCSGFAVMGRATREGLLYHGRVLDYAVDWRLQEHALLIVAEPEGKIPFVNVSFAGFIGSVTGMNAERVSIGEMGGRGFGQWDGVPMAALVRMALEQAKTLEEAVAVFEKHPRTCEYYYVIADGKTGRAVAMEASAGRFEVVGPGESNPRLPHAIPDCVLLSAGDRYEELARQVRANLGQIDAEAALRLMDRPVAMESNLHNVLFEPGSTRFWFALATKDGKPAAGQPYAEFQLSELLLRRPPEQAQELPCPALSQGAVDISLPITDVAGPRAQSQKR